MLRSALVSLVGILVLVLLACASATLAQNTDAAQNGVAEVQTGTAVDDPSPPSTAAAACADYVERAIEQQWETAAAEVLESLKGCRAFTPKNEKKLSEIERNASARARYLYRLDVLTQLAEKTTT